LKHATAGDFIGLISLKRD